MYLKTQCARHFLLRCYMDLAYADQARLLLDSHPADLSAAFVYTRALIEHISILIGEGDASSELRMQAVVKVCMQLFKCERVYVMYVYVSCMYFMYVSISFSIHFVQV